MNFLYFISLLMVSGVVFFILYGLLSFPVMGLIWLAGKIGERKPLLTKLLMIPILPISVFKELFCVLLWSSWVVAKTLISVSSPGVTHRWSYWIDGFFAAPAPYQWMAGKELEIERRSEGSPNYRRDLGARLLILIVIGMFFMFALCPSLLAVFYGKFLGLPQKSGD